MTLEPGVRLGPYDVIAALGAGGMGEVYRARDTTLHRDVALKVLPEAFASDPERMARFAREAQVLASLNHPNIAAIYGLEASTPARALVLELVEGPTLADRIAGGPLGLEEALPIARQIADALDAAHEQGIIHRDLKPASIKERPDGTVKVLDFGLAKALDPVLGSGEVSQSPTITSPAMTRAGMVLGTAAYMSPEQARGRQADKRSDVWAFGCVLYEMLTGTRVFDADGMSDTIAAVLRADPDWGALPADTPASVRRLLRRCLEKDSKRRLADIHDARLELDESLSEPAAGRLAAATRFTGRERLAWAIAGLVVVAALVAVMMLRTRSGQSSAIETGQFAIPPPDNTILASEANTLAISPDGRLLVFGASSVDGSSRLWVRPIDSLSARPIAGTESAIQPFWSPDGKSIGFFAEGKLKRVDVEDGPVQTLADVSFPLGGTWNDEGVIVFASGFGTPLLRVSSGGGTTTPVTSLADAPLAVHSGPQFLPDGRHFLFGVDRGPFDQDIHVGSLDGVETTRLVQSDTRGTYAPPGYLLYVRAGVLVAQPFDASQQTLSGEAVAVPEATAFVGAAFSTSRTGTLVYRRSTMAQSHAVWVDRSGKRGTLAAPAGSSAEPALSPDEKRLAFARGSGTGMDVWVQEIERRITSRFTIHPSLNNVPLWSPDGRTIAFATGRNGGLDIYQRLSNSAGSDEPLVRLGGIPIVFPSDWSRDGRFLAYYRTDIKTHLDMWVLPLEGDRQPFAFLKNDFNESQGQFSPDGKWMAYVSDESGAPQVYVQSFPTLTGREQVSPGGGTQPRWRRDGRELFYLAADGNLMVVPVRSGATFGAAAPRPLFVTQLPRAALRQSYDVSADGQRFLLYEAIEGASPAVTVVLNWPALLKP